MRCFYRGHNSVLLPGPGRKHIKRLLVGAPILLCLYLFTVGDSGFFRIWHRDQQIVTLQQEISALRAENARLEATTRLLERDLDEIERIARERYGMVKKNESVYMVYPSPPAERNGARP